MSSMPHAMSISECNRFPSVILNPRFRVESHTRGYRELEPSAKSYPVEEGIVQIDVKEIVESDERIVPTTAVDASRDPRSKLRGIERQHLQI